MGGTVEPRAGRVTGEGDYLVASGVSKSFQDKRVLHALDLSVRKGELVSLLGP